MCTPHVLAAPMPMNDAAMQVAAIDIVDHSPSTQAVKHISINAQKKRALPLEKRAPPVSPNDTPTTPKDDPATPKDGPSPAPTPNPTPPVQPPTTDPNPPATTDPKPPVTTDPKPPVTVDPKPPITPTTTTTTTTTRTTTSSEEETTTTTTRHSSSPNKPTGTNKPNPVAPGPHSSAPSVTFTSTSSTISPTATPEKASGTPILPIVLGSVLGGGVLIAAGVFFFLRFRKGRRFDRKRPLSFLAVSLDDPSGSDRHLSTSSGGALAGALAVARGGLDRDNDEIRYSPPTPIGAPNDRHSYSTSDNSGAALTWNPDDENASLVGGYGQQHNQQQYHQGEERDLLSDENGFRPPSESFVATSMMPLAQNDPRHQRFSGGRVQGAFSPEPEMRELTPGQLRVVGSPSPSHADVEPAQGARASLEVRSEGADVRSQHGSIRSNVSGKDPQTDELKYL
ncbi:hypothetical protein CPC16_011884 [Podila verticillata]|nr:hypothetical protein CPC16_011884 [Podila verticillata]